LSGNGESGSKQGSSHLVNDVVRTWYFPV
jgi:hypothetical protein